MINDIKNLIKRTLDNRGRGITIGSIIKFTILAIILMFALSIILAVFKWTFGITNNSSVVSNLDKVFSEPEMLLQYADESTRGVTGGTAVRGKAISPSIGIMPPMPIEPAGKDAENYETREYTARFERSNITPLCEEFEGLKPLEYVVFSNANKSDTYCNYTFKVEVAKEDEIISLIKSLGPKEFNASTFTLERNITSNKKEIEILEKKLKMLNSLLESAQEKYNKLRNSGDTNALVQAINNEINLIERITNQKLSVQAQIDRLTNSTGVQEERIDYSQFNISVQQRKLVDLTNIGEDWARAFERFISNISVAVQDLTIGLLMFIFKLIKFVLYISVGIMMLTVAARFLWKLIRRVWSI